MSFLHCDHNEQYLTLHDCVAERAYFEDGKLGFEFPDGFWISPEHPDSHLTKLVRTDASRVEYILRDGMDYDVDILVYKRSIDGEITGRAWTVCELVDAINAGTCKLEFLYQYVCGDSRIVECQLIFDKKPYWKECEIKMSVSEACYYWNNLRSDRVW